jgi:hypothetical protein
MTRPSSVQIVVLVVGATLSLLGGFADEDQGLLLAAIAILATGVAYLFIEIQRGVASSTESLKKEAKLAFEGLKKQHEVQWRETRSAFLVVQALSAINDEFGRSLGRHLMANAKGAISLLSRAEATYPSEHLYLNHLSRKVSGFGPGDRLLAICAAKEWNDEFTRKYFEANRDAAKLQDVQISRIFVEPKPSALDEAIRQEQTSINVWIAPRAEINKLKIHFRIPQDMGLAIFRDEVLVHRGVGEDVVANVYRDAQLIFTFKTIYYQLLDASLSVAEYQAKYQAPTRT